jgi:hypothetical protein
MKTMKKLNVKCQDDACLMKAKRMMKLRRSLEVIMKYHKPKKKDIETKQASFCTINKMKCNKKKTHYDDPFM